jgi:hypothetical protein
MECRVPVRRSSATLFLLLLWALVSVAVADERTVVLVTGSGCPISGIDNLDLRKVYLGVGVSIDGSHIRPVRLRGDDQLDRIFFQIIVAMSRKSYERRALSLALKFGAPRPMEYTELGEALDAVRRMQCGIVYTWADEIAGEPGIKVLKPLWRGK